VALVIQYALKAIQTEESWAPVPYYCSERYPTTGWGFKVGEKDGPLPKTTMTREEGDAKLYALVKALHENFCTHSNTCRIYPRLSDVRKATLISMAYQIGFAGVLKFPQMLAALASESYHGAAVAALDSLVARSQTPERWKRNAYMIETGIFHKYYGVL